MCPYIRWFAIKYAKIVIHGYSFVRTSVSVSIFHNPSIFSLPDDNLSECECIFTKLGMCIDIVKIWFGIANGQTSSVVERVISMSDLSFLDDNE